jgi:hypothetical protein
MLSLCCDDPLFLGLRYELESSPSRPNKQRSNYGRNPERTAHQLIDREQNRFHQQYQAANP